MLAKRLEREADLGARRSRHDDLTQRLRKADEQRLAHEQSLEPLRERIGKLQLEEQAAQLGGRQYLEQLEAAGADLEALAAGIAAGGVKLGGLQGEIDRLNAEITALGAVNLAALEELTHARERKTFLDAQNADLSEAMTTLEDAIRKIDLETRALLQETFDQVNAHFGRMFPSLFGGGNAKLVMTGDEILDAGVQVMAQPPGKKNSTIHLLSGGEKALTAIALVFAIFQLNPAPFCLLDEVDAQPRQGDGRGDAVPLHQPQQDRDGDGRAAHRRDHAGAGRVAHRHRRHAGGHQPGRGGVTVRAAAPRSPRRHCIAA